MLRTVGTGSNKWNIHFGLHRRGKFNLGFLRRFVQSLKRECVLTYINAGLLLKFFAKPIDNFLVNVFASQVSVAVRGLYFYHIVSNFQNGNIECAATEVEDYDFFIFLFVEAIGKRRRRRLVYNALYVKSGNFARVLGSLSLRIVEVRGHGNNRLGNFFSETGFGVILELGEYHGRNFFGAIPLARHVYFNATVFRFPHFKRHGSLVLLHGRFIERVPDEALDLINGVFRIRDTLTLREKSHKTLFCF